MENPRTHVAAITVVCVLVVSSAGARSLDRSAAFRFDGPQARSEAVDRLLEAGRRARAEAVAEAKRRGWPLRGEAAGGGRFELVEVRQGRPIYNVTYNENAAISTAADLVRLSSDYAEVDGSGALVGVWDCGAARDTHREFGDRLIAVDGVSDVLHPTHVAGTIAATGVDPAARGMAPGATVESYDWVYDTAEMAERAAIGPGDVNGLSVSNHSYGIPAGWQDASFSGVYGPHWFGAMPEGEDAGFGCYDAKSADWDALCYAAPCYLPFQAAGNDRNDVPPEPGTVFYFKDAQDDWISKTYDPAVDPGGDGAGAGGYDTLPHVAVAKNVMTVGAVGDATYNGLRQPGFGEMTAFSSWGPTDDGRIKPDIVANGVILHSAAPESDDAYAVMSGTSTAAPNAAGSAALLVDLYRRLFDGQAMRASTLKALIIHTADDLGEPGPDYRFGWGLMDTQAAADQIQALYEAPAADYIVEDTLSESVSFVEHAFNWNGVDPLRVTLCWTDPAAEPLEVLDDPSPRLVNDLDVRLIDPDGNVYYPFVLDPVNPAAPAQQGDNVLDNVEQILLESPPELGVYRVEVTCKGQPAGGVQAFSLVISGQSPCCIGLAPAEDFVTTGAESGNFAPSNKTYTLMNLGHLAMDWQAACEAGWLAFHPSSGALEPGESVEVEVTLNPQAVEQTPGVHESLATITNTGTGAIRPLAVIVNVYARPELGEIEVNGQTPPNQEYAPDPGFCNSPTAEIHLFDVTNSPTEIEIDEDSAFGSPTRMPFEAGVLEYPYTFDDTGEGVKTVYVRLRNPAGASEARSAIGILDMSSPSSEATGPYGGAVGPVIDIEFEATDQTGQVQSGLRDIELWYRRNSGEWTLYESGLSPYSSISFDTSRTGGPGDYDCFTIAFDRAGNMEDVWLTPDVSFTVSEPQATPAAPATFWLLF